jgi:polyisoprenoid-binding protein YceI
MKQYCPLSLCAALALGLFSACSDPAENVHQTSAAAPAKMSQVGNAAGTPFMIRPESKVGFVGSKVTGSHDGGFTQVTGTLQVDGGRIVGSPQVKIALDSLWSDNERLTGHLKSADFFDVQQFPTSTFTVTAIEASGPEQKITGNLHLHGVTKSITFPAKILVSDESVTVQAEFAINRKDFGINYPGKPNDLIRDNVVIKLDLKATPGSGSS